ncbi:MAG: hypothetical protein A3D28_02470 [Omnitrophica bacterium RIFCSPHIGHO2_02_FULL_63_14]|nr:MAG: hypothetical protein A3D28_02470 [Omnitrophica bacterium RIFCSPHIGHO2_02_FULL_63_14]
MLGLKISDRERQKPGKEFFLDCGPSLIGLIQADNSKSSHPFADAGPGANHVSFRVPAAEFDGVVSELEARGIEITFVKKREFSWSVYFLDPDGNKLEMTAWPKEDGHSPAGV